MKRVYDRLLIEAVEELGGVSSRERQFKGGKVTSVHLREGNPFGKPAGLYHTVELGAVQGLQEESLQVAVHEIAELIIPMLRGRRVLVAALGNNDITPDSLGPKIMRHLMITRPFALLQSEVFETSGLRSVAAVCTNVFGATGVESAEMIDGLCRRIGAETVIVIDALATEQLSRLCSTVQISDGGIAPGAGVGNHRITLDQSSLGVPVISMGVPTVISGKRLACLLDADEEKTAKLLAECEDDLIVTPTQIATATDNGAKLIAFALNRALHDRLSIEDMLGYLS